MLQKLTLVTALELYKKLYTIRRYVIFYNERLDGITYPNGNEVTNIVTELCEVTTLGRCIMKKPL